MQKKSILYVFCFFAGYLNAQVSDFDHIDFTKADRIALSYNKERLTNLPELAYKLTTDLTTDVERFRALYRWVCANIANDYGLYLKNNRKRQYFKNDSLKLNAWNDKFRRRLFKKLLKKKQTICTGYAYLVKALADLVNIECEIVHGYGRVSTTNIETLNLPNHSWNAVKLNGKWYLCDPTWASGIPNPKTKNFVFLYNDGFFLANPKLFAVNHFPIDNRWWLLEDNIPSFEEFLAAPVIYGNAYKTLELHNAPEQMHHNIKKNEKVAFNYKLKKSIKAEKVKLLLDNGDDTWRANPTSISIDNTFLKLEHQFKRKGFYDVHLYLNGDLISTYTVEVKAH
ncbi:transglutaminase domain-containing protein [Winogradskyella sp.]|uniref:transglutaminase domain-containing protein n=1 Tax=Winogradskyella sp. TaxID=1883156 RepID=UPI00261AF2D2|nr:transglutaminase domain-containing protein [Winogradskyella sp.]